MKVVPLRLQPGADQHQTLETWMGEQEEQAGCVISAVGSLSVAQLRLAAAVKATVIHGELEILSLSGTLSPDGAHLHDAIAGSSGAVIGGHLCAGSLVRTTTELVIGLLPEWRFNRELTGSPSKVARGLALQLFIPAPLSPEEAAPRRVLLPKRAITPLLHETLAWPGFQLEEQPLSCQDVPAWIKRLRDRQLALPLGPGLLDPGWIEAQGLDDQPPLAGAAVAAAAGAVSTPSASALSSDSENWRLSFHCRLTLSQELTGADLIEQRWPTPGFYS